MAVDETVSRDKREEEMRDSLFLSMVWYVVSPRNKRNTVIGFRCEQKIASRLGSGCNTSTAEAMTDCNACPIELSHGQFGRLQHSWYSCALYSLFRHAVAAKIPEICIELAAP